MRDYQKKRRERLPLIQELFALGISASWIAEQTGWSVGTIVKDLRVLGGVKRFTTRPRGKAIFRTALKRYAELVAAEGLPLRDALAQWIGEREILQSLRGMEMVRECLTVPGYPPGREGYVRLVGAVFGGIQIRNFQAESSSSSIVWREYLTGVAAGDIPPAASYVDLERDLALRHMAEWRAQIMPIWPDELFLAIDELLAEFSAREQKVLVMRFGLDDGVTHSLQEVAAELDVTRERIRQVEAKALRKLRHPTRSRVIRPFVDPVDIAVSHRFVERKQARVELEQALATRHEEPAEKLLDKPPEADEASDVGLLGQTLMRALREAGQH